MHEQRDIQTPQNTQLSKLPNRRTIRFVNPKNLKTKIKTEKEELYLNDNAVHQAVQLNCTNSSINIKRIVQAK